MQIKNIIAGVLEVSVDEISNDTAIGDLPSWDSIRHLQVIAAIEQNFNIRFTPDIMLDLEDVGDIIATTEARVQQ